MTFETRWAAVASAAVAEHGAIQKQTELALLVQLVASRRPRVVLEIGTAAGGTLWAWCQCAADDAELVSIDLPGGDYGGGYPEEHVPTLAGYVRPGQRLRLIRADSHRPDVRAEAVEHLAGEQVDLLFIDGDHTEEGCWADWVDYGGLVRPGGLVAFHDVLAHPQHPDVGVHRVWRRVKRTNDGRREWEFCDRSGDPNAQWGGIGVIEA